MENKYNIDFNDEVIRINISRLINQVWKLIPMKENDEDCIKQLETVIVEVVGLSEIFLRASQYLQILSKLEGLKQLQEDINFDVHRKTVFEIINLFQELKNGKKF